MRFHREYKRLKDTEFQLKTLPFEFGPNKRQELMRLIYELSKRDNISPGAIIKKAIKDKNFQSSKQAFIYLKDYFLKKRFPESYLDARDYNFFFPKISLNNNYRVLKKNFVKFYPKKIFIEEDIKDYSLVKSILKKFPLAKPNFIRQLKNYIKSNKDNNLIDSYNLRSNNLFLIKERYDFIKPCPCSQRASRCNYDILNLGFGCIYECSYCFLQSYTNINGIILPINIDDFLNRLNIFLKRNTLLKIIGTGEFTDSLALDDLTGYSRILINFFSRQNNAILELKTKSNNIKNILKLKHNRKTVISWSLNPQTIIDSDEWMTSSLKERIEAAKECCDAGYLVGFHFDPIIYSTPLENNFLMGSTNWQNLYKNLIDTLFKNIDSKNIAWISLGTFRFAPKLKTIIEQRFPQNKILDEELIIGFDKKLRYNQEKRVQVYKKMVSWIRSYSNSVLIYLCMEPKKIWRKVLDRSGRLPLDKNPFSDNICF